MALPGEALRFVSRHLEIVGQRVHPNASASVALFDNGTLLAPSAAFASPNAANGSLFVHSVRRSAALDAAQCQPPQPTASSSDTRATVGTTTSLDVLLSHETGDFDGGGDVATAGLRVAGLAQPITFSISVSAERVAAALPAGVDVDAVLSQLQCAWWDNAAKDWSVAGCHAVGFTSSAGARYVQCASTHLTGIVTRSLYRYRGSCSIDGVIVQSSLWCTRLTAPSRSER